MKISEIGEWGIIKEIFDIISREENVKLPYGDDAVAIKLPNTGILVINTDMLVYETDVPPNMSSEQIGRKAVVMCISDLAAKGARPLGFLATLGLKRDMEVEELRGLIWGMEKASREYGFHILGGDTNEACDLIIAGTALGVARRVISRHNAEVGDIVAVTGLFGNTAAGFKILFEGLETSKKIKDKILKSIYEPKAHMIEGVTLAEKELATAAIDSSDGLAISLHEIAEKSNVGLEIYRLPITEEAKKFSVMNNLDPFELVFYGGEEYNLVVTIKREKIKEALKTMKEKGGKLIPIGRVTREKGKVTYRKGGEERIIEKKGWEHFR